MSIYDLASRFTAETNQSIFITGKAGTGKTTFLHKLKEETHKQMAVVAPTGVAAINAGGVTIHSFFQLPFAPFLPTLEGEAGLISKLKMNSARRAVIRELELLVIDEISMVRADVLDAIDVVLRHVRHRRGEPFGGVQMVFIGDMYQLSPVVRGDELNLLSNYYSGIYFFNSKVLEKQNPVYIEFDKIFRQSDTTFIELLNQVRNDTLTQKGIDILQSRYNPTFRPSEKDFHITLTTHNSKADEINNEELAKLNAKTKTFKAGIKGQFNENSYPSDEVLELKKGARVMFVKNDTEQPRRFYNGKIGTITMFDEEEEIIYVQPDDPNEDVISVTKMSWDNVRYSTDTDTLELIEEIVGTFTQYPLRLAWAITIHKSQGLTFDKAVIDAGDSFAPGQVYVALSRCRTLEGITLLSHINRYSIRNDAQVVEFSSQQSDVETLTQKLNEAQHQYRLNQLISLFDFSPIAYFSKIWHSNILELRASFNDETIPYIRAIINKLTEVENISSKFQIQLKNIFHSTPFDETHLNERIKAASGYYDVQIATIVEDLFDSPATTDSKANAKIYDDGLNEIFSILSLKRHIINGIANNSSLENLFDRRKSFHLPNFTITSHSKATSSKKLTSQHPKLLSLLIQKRNEIASEKSIQVYMVVNTSSLVDMSNYLPISHKEMMQIAGMGPVRMQNYGDIFLEIISTYVAENDIDAEQIEVPTKKEKKKSSKVKKGASALESLSMYKKGMSIADIAKERQFVESTIAGHLSSFLSTGEVDILDFVSQDDLNKAIDLVKEKSPDVSYFKHLLGHFGQLEHRFLNTYLINQDKKE